MRSTGERMMLMIEYRIRFKTYIVIAATECIQCKILWIKGDSSRRFPGT